MRHVISTLGAALLLSGLMLPASAQAPAPATGSGGRAMSETQTSTKEPPPSAATRAYMDAANQMHIDLAVPFSNDADKDFAAVIAAHHKGAVELARVELRYGKDPEMRKLAEQIVSANERDMAALKAWQAKHR